jgi:hypothetical protein
LVLPAELLVQLSVNQPPSIKQYQEAIVAHLTLQHPAFLQELLLPQITSVEKGGAATGSHILIAVQVSLHSPPEQQLAVLPQLLKLLLPWTNHHTHHIRTFAQLGFCALLVRAYMQRTAACEQPSQLLLCGPCAKQQPGQVPTTNIIHQMHMCSSSTTLLATSQSKATPITDLATLIHQNAAFYFTGCQAAG